MLACLLVHAKLGREDGCMNVAILTRSSSGIKDRLGIAIDIGSDDVQEALHRYTST